MIILLLYPLVFHNNWNIMNTYDILRYTICYIHRQWISMLRVRHEIKPGTAFRRRSRHMSSNQYQTILGLSHTIYLQWKAIGQAWLPSLRLWYHVIWCDHCFPPSHSHRHWRRSSSSPWSSCQPLQAQGDAWSSLWLYDRLSRLRPIDFLLNWNILYLLHCAIYVIDISWSWIYDMFCRFWTTVNLCLTNELWVFGVKILTSQL